MSWICPVYLSTQLEADRCRARTYQSPLAFPKPQADLPQPQRASKLLGEALHPNPSCPSCGTVWQSRGRTRCALCKLPVSKGRSGFQSGLSHRWPPLLTDRPADLQFLLGLWPFVYVKPNHVMWMPDKTQSTLESSRSLWPSGSTWTLIHLYHEQTNRSTLLSLF